MSGRRRRQRSESTVPPPSQRPNAFESNIQPVLRRKTTLQAFEEEHQPEYTVQPLKTYTVHVEHAKNNNSL